MIGKGIAPRIPRDPPPVPPTPEARWKTSARVPSHEVRLVAVAARLAHAQALADVQRGVGDEPGDQIAHAPARDHGALEGLALAVSS